MREIQLFLFTKAEAGAKNQFNKWFTSTQPGRTQSQDSNSGLIDLKVLKFAFISHGLIFLSVYWE